MTTVGERDSADESRDLVESLCLTVLAGDPTEGLQGVAVSRCATDRYAGVVFASNQTAAELESIQETLGEGPGPMALSGTGPVLVPDLPRDRRAAAWVAFVHQAGGLGVRSVFAFPVSVGASGLGLLTLHGTAPHALTERTLADLLRLSDAVALALLAPQREPLTVDDLAEVLDAAHAVTHQAVGMVSVQISAGLDDALVTLRAYAFAQDMRLVDVAREVVERRLHFRDGGVWREHQPER